MAKTEIARISEVIDKAVHAFTDVLNLNFSEDLQTEPDDFLEKLEQEEYLLEALQELTDDEMMHTVKRKMATNLKKNRHWFSFYTNQTFL